MLNGTSGTPQPSNPATLFLARLLSFLGHPLLIVPLTVAVVSRNWKLAALVAGTTMLPLAAFIVRQVRRGAWSDFDVSRREERSGLYYAAIPILIVAGAVLYATGASPGMLRGLAAGAAMLTAGLLGMRWLKISLHMMFAAWCAVVLCHSHPAATLPALAFVAAVAWSRRHLDRHTWAEIAVGLAIGAAAGWWTIIQPGTPPAV